MSVPARKDETRVEPEEKLTTADLAQGKRPPTSEVRAKPTPEQVRDEPVKSVSSDTRNTTDNAPLFPHSELEELRNRWHGIQTAFVDEPRRAVEQADGLVALAMKRLAEVFAQERSKLEEQWGRGGDVSTEDLRIALQRYRSFFHRLLSV